MRAGGCPEASQRTLDTHAGWHGATHRQENDKAEETIHHNAARSLWGNYNSDCPQTNQLSPNWPKYLFIYFFPFDQITCDSEIHQMIKKDYTYWNV